MGEFNGTFDQISRLKTRSYAKNRKTGIFPSKLYPFAHVVSCTTQAICQSNNLSTHDAICFGFDFLWKHLIFSGNKRGLDVIITNR